MASVHPCAGDLITALKLKPGDVIEIKNRVVVRDPSNYASNGQRILKGYSPRGKPYYYHYDAMESVHVVSRVPRHPTPNSGDIWLPRKGMLPVYYDGYDFLWPTGTAQTVIPTGKLGIEDFFKRFPDAKFVVNTKNGRDFGSELWVFSRKVIESRSRATERQPPIAGSLLAVTGK